jgi:hypothetical protein
LHRLLFYPLLLAGEVGRRVDIATAGVTTAGAIPNPRIEVNTGRNGTPSPSAQAGTVVGVGVSQFIENPELRSARVNTALYAEQTSVQSLSQIRNELVGQVKLRAYEYLLRMRVDRIKKTSIGEAEGEVASAKKKLAALEAISAAALWLKELDEFLEAWNVAEPKMLHVMSASCEEMLVPKKKKLVKKTK